VVEIAQKVNNPDLLEAETTIKVNEMFHEIAEKSRKEIGTVDTKRVYEEWLEWFKKYAKAV
jgi:thymidylate kinase